MHRWQGRCSSHLVRDVLQAKHAKVKRFLTAMRLAFLKSKVEGAFCTEATTAGILVFILLN